MAPLENRNGNKLSNSVIKCRFLGFGDFYGVEVRRGYKLLREYDRKVIYSIEVVFKENEILEALPESDHSEYWTPTESEKFSRIDEAISQGRIVTERGSEFTDDLLPPESES